MSGGCSFALPVLADAAAKERLRTHCRPVSAVRQRQVARGDSARIPCQEPRRADLASDGVCPVRRLNARVNALTSW